MPHLETKAERIEYLKRLHIATNGPLEHNYTFKQGNRYGKNKKSGK